MKLIVTRHGETDWNKIHKFAGSTDISLNGEGRKQAEKLALRLKDCNIETIFSSPLRRALDTAQEIKKYHPAAELVVEDGLKEVNFGVFEGLTMDEVKERHKDIWKKRAVNKFDYKVPDGESYAESYERVLRVLNKIAELGKDSVIVAHGTLNKLLFMRLTGKPLEELERQWYNNTSVSIFEIKGNDVIVEEFNCDKHLK